jgi:hypothetical protein
MSTAMETEEKKPAATAECKLVSTVIVNGKPGHGRRHDSEDTVD